MSPNMKTLLAAVLAITPALANPTLPILHARQDFGSCRNQSCEVATVAGSTGATVYTYDSYPVNDTPAGDCCIIRNFPAVKEPLYAARPNLQAYCAANGGDAPVQPNPPGVNSVSVATPTSKAKRATVSCAPNILIFAKGTLEPGDLGITIGPQLQSNLPSNQWLVVGFNYDNSFDNDYCLGLPGNVNAQAVLAQYTAACPNSNIAMSGYSQGAMVIRNALARAPIAQVQRVTNVVTFGDPFCGAQIGQYTGPVHVFCMTGDGVCNGQLDVSLVHLSYGVDISQAVSILQAGANPAPASATPTPTGLFGGLFGFL